MSLYVALFIFQIGAPVVAGEWRARSMFLVKSYLAQEAGENRVMVFAGSNATFGVSGKTVEQIVGRPTVNFGTFLTIGTPYIDHFINQFARSGDMIVVPLEFVFYYEDSPYRIGNVNATLVWHDTFDRNLSLSDWVVYFSKTSPVRVLEGVYAKAAPGKKNKWMRLNSESAVSQVKKIWASGSKGWKGWSHESLTPHGDLLRDIGPTLGLRQLIEEGHSFIKPDQEISDFFIQRMKNLEAILEARGAKFVLTWPITLQHHAFDLSDKNHQKMVLEVAQKLRSEGIEIYCNPAAFHLPPEFFWDTVYHPSRIGAELRSKNLGECLNDLSGQVFKGDYDFEAVLAQVEQQANAVRHLLPPAETADLVSKPDLTEPGTSE